MVGPQWWGPSGGGPSGGVPPAGPHAHLASLATSASFAPRSSCHSLRMPAAAFTSASSGRARSAPPACRSRSRKHADYTTVAGSVRRILSFQGHVFKGMEHDAINQAVKEVVGLVLSVAGRAEEQSASDGSFEARQGSGSGRSGGTGNLTLRGPLTRRNEWCREATRARRGEEGGLGSSGAINV